jgi:hypothetical protein
MEKIHLIFGHIYHLWLPLEYRWILHYDMEPDIDLVFCFLSHMDLSLLPLNSQKMGKYLLDNKYSIKIYWINLLKWIWFLSSPSSRLHISDYLILFKIVSCILGGLCLILCHLDNTICYIVLLGKMLKIHRPGQ